MLYDGEDEEVKDARPVVYFYAMTLKARQRLATTRQEPSLRLTNLARRLLRDRAQPYERVC